MTKRDIKGKPKKPAKRPTDVNQLMHFLGAQSTAEPPAPVQDPTEAEISRVMSALGRRGGRIGGKRRLETLTQERRSQIAYKAAQARWSKKAKKP
jgi:hypothetical protein